MEEGTRARDVAPTGIRIPPDLRQALQREAHIHGRSLSGEILHRLKASLTEEPAANPPRSGEPVVVYAPDAGSGRMLSDAQRMLLAMFDALPPDQQLAWLTVLRR